MRLPPHTGRFVAPAVVMVLAIIGYFVVFRSTQAEPKRMTALVIEQTGLKDMKSKAARSDVITASEENWKVVKAAAKAQPDQTAGYARTWESTKPSSRSISILVEVLPSASDANVMQKQVMEEYSNPKTLKSQKTTVTSRFSVPGVTESRGVNYEVATSGSGSSGTSATSGIVISFVVGHAVAVVYDEAPAPAARSGNIRTVAQSQSALIQQQEPRFSLTVSTRTPLASFLYLVVALAVTACTYLVPLGVQRARNTRKAHQISQASYGRRARGGKVLKRRKASPLLQPSRRR